MAAVFNLVRDARFGDGGHVGEALGGGFDDVQFVVLLKGVAGSRWDFRQPAPGRAVGC